MKKLLLLIIALLAISCKKNKCGECEEIHESYYTNAYIGTWDKTYDSKIVYLCGNDYQDFSDVNNEYQGNNTFYCEKHQIICD